MTHFTYVLPSRSLLVASGCLLTTSVLIPTWLAPMAHPTAWCPCCVCSTTARYVDQGGGKRKGSFAVSRSLGADIFAFLDLKKNHGNELERARDLFYALWIPDLFMQRVEADGEWSLFCPNECPGLADCWGEEFKALYEKYEKEGKARKQFKAQKLWFAILQSQVETGTPYVLFKDAANGKSNQQNLGTIKSSNLCTEIIENFSRRGGRMQPCIATCPTSSRI